MPECRRRAHWHSRKWRNGAGTFSNKRAHQQGAMMLVLVLSSTCMMGRAWGAEILAIDTAVRGRPRAAGCSSLSHSLTLCGGAWCSEQGGRRQRQALEEDS